MKYDPKITEADLFPEGWYPGIVNAVNERLTKKDRVPMTVVDLKVYNGGASQDVTDYIVSNLNRHMVRFRALCAAVGADFGSGDVDTMKFINKDVDVRLGIQHDDEWGDKNVVYSYAKPGTKTATPPATAGIPPEIVFDENDPALKADDIPF